MPCQAGYPLTLVKVLQVWSSLMGRTHPTQPNPTAPVGVGQVLCPQSKSGCLPFSFHPPSPLPNGKSGMRSGSCWLFQNLTSGPIAKKNMWPQSFPVLFCPGPAPSLMSAPHVTFAPTCPWVLCPPPSTPCCLTIPLPLVCCPAPPPPHAILLHSELRPIATATFTGA